MHLKVPYSNYLATIYVFYMIFKILYMDDSDTDLWSTLIHDNTSFASVDETWEDDIRFELKNLQEDCFAPKENI